MSTVYCAVRKWINITTSEIPCHGIHTLHVQLQVNTKYWQV